MTVAKTLGERVGRWSWSDVRWESNGLYRMPIKIVFILLPIPRDRTIYYNLKYKKAESEINSKYLSQMTRGWNYCLECWSP